MRAVLFENSRLLDPTQDHVLEGLSVLVEGDTIREVSARPPRLAGATVVDCDGRTLMPGLIDCHVHVFLSEVNIRALEKWSRERLELRFLPGGTVHALFRYGGTTCSNLGRPLEFHYALQLGPAEDGYPILQAECAPAPDDVGHQSMCEFLNNPRSLMESIAREKPLLGQPINDVLSWQRPYSPSGCYCDSDRRIHKWGLVFEVVHFALVRHEHNHGNDASCATLQD